MTFALIMPDETYLRRIRYVQGEGFLRRNLGKGDQRNQMKISPGELKTNDFKPEKKQEPSCEHYRPRVIKTSVEKRKKALTAVQNDQITYRRRKETKKHRRSLPTQGGN